MAITKDQFKAANARGAAAVARGPIAQAARYDSRRGLIVITLEGGCEFAFPVALAEGLADAPRSKLRKIKISRTGSACIGRCWMPISMYRASSKAPSVHVGGCNRLANSGGQAAVRSRRRPPVRTVSAAVVPKRKRPLSAPLLSCRYRAC